MRYLDVARGSGALSVLPLALSQRFIVCLHAGELAQAAVLQDAVSAIQTLQTQLALTNAVVGQMTAAQQGAGGQQVDAAELGQAVDALYQEGVAQLSPGTPPVQMGPLFPSE